MSVLASIAHRESRSLIALSVLELGSLSKSELLGERPCERYLPLMISQDLYAPLLQSGPDRFDLQISHSQASLPMHG